MSKTDTTAGLAIAGNRSSAPVSHRFVDLHCHCLPNVDDGPASVEDAVGLCRRLRDDNVFCVVATPHQLGPYEGRTTTVLIRETARRLHEELARQSIDLELRVGAEIRLDERIDRLVANDEVLTLADRKRHILLELPSDVFIDIAPLLARLRVAQIGVILAHPERNTPLLRRPGVLLAWLEEGVDLQITAASLVGGFGPVAEQAAWDFVASGWATLVATDAHDQGSDYPGMPAAFRHLAERWGIRMAQLLCAINPWRVISGKAPVSALRRRRAP